MPNTVFKRKIYNKMLEWKDKYKGSYALLIRGARRVGKSTIAKEFAQNEYRSHIIIDFAYIEPDLDDLFNDMRDLDFFFLQLQQLTGVKLYNRESVIVFDEIQLRPHVRQMIKYLVADGRYDYIETGSLISIKKNVENILIPSEEHKISMYPMDFEEFLDAVNDNMTWDIICEYFDAKKPLGDALHRKIMRRFRLYMLVGGMPMAVKTYINENNLSDVDLIKREIIDLYIEDFINVDSTGFIGNVFKTIPAQLARKSKGFSFTISDRRGKNKDKGEVLFDMVDSFTVNASYHVDDPNVAMALNLNTDDFKLFTADTGIFVTLAFMDSDYTENEIYNKLLSDKLPVNLGHVYENVVSQMLVSSGKNLFYHVMKSYTSNRNYEIDFLTTSGTKLYPIEVKSSAYRRTASLDRFMEKYSSRVGGSYIIHTKDLSVDGKRIYLPTYMTSLL